MQEFHAFNARQCEVVGIRLAIGVAQDEDHHQSLSSGNSNSLSNCSLELSFQGFSNERRIHAQDFQGQVEVDVVEWRVGNWASRVRAASYEARETRAVSACTVG